DTSGPGLHKRGYRLDANEAPLKETLAAALVYLARVKDYHTLYDPMCGSGTILIEGTMLAHNIAPGLKRKFTAESWKNIPQEVWQQERTRAQDLIKLDSDFKAYGSDIDDKSLEIAKLNSKRAGVDSKIEYYNSDIRNFTPKTQKGTVICNPPYGERMLEVKEAENLYLEMGKRFDKRPGWAYYIISPADNFEVVFGRRADKRRKLYNGMIKCQVFMYYKQ
ncbi:MAG: N-6 DNA methylase, partial [Oscillospiraceae bacterium]|nr:N-6 DNA methylase [Oscillospiraceae bacterium]